MANFNFNGTSIYIDDRLKEQIDTKVIPDLMKRDKDVVFGVDGKEGSGKSKFADIIGSYASTQLKTEYDLSCICTKPLEFRDKIKSAKKNQVVIYDEAHRGMASRRTLSEINSILIDLMMEMRQKNLFVIIVLPTFFMLDRYVALYRLKGLFHIYERHGKRGFWVYFKEKHKLYLYIKGKKLYNYNCMRWPRFRGRFYNQYAINEEEYRAKKAHSFEEKERVTRAEIYIEQRDRLLGLLHDEFNLSGRKITKLLKTYGVPLKHTQVADILVKMRGITTKMSASAEQILMNNTLLPQNNKDSSIDYNDIEEKTVVENSTTD